MRKDEKILTLMNESDFYCLLSARRGGDCGERVNKKFHFQKKQHELAWISEENCRLSLLTQDERHLSRNQLS